MNLVVLSRDFNLQISHPKHKSIVRLLQVLQTTVLFTEGFFGCTQLLEYLVALSFTYKQESYLVGSGVLLGCSDITLQTVKLSLQSMVIIFHSFQLTDTVGLVSDDLLRF